MRSDIRSYRGEQFTLTGHVTRGEAVSTAAVIAGAAVVPVDSTSGYPGAGSLEVSTSLGSFVVAYTGTTATSFTGCTNTPAIPDGSLIPYAVDIRSGTGLTFDARRARGGAAVVHKAVGSGITIPAAAPGNVYTIAIVAADTNAFTRTEELLYEIRLVEASGDVTVLATDVWRVALGAS